jgi:hypothetical protein
MRQKASSTGRVAVAAWTALVTIGWLVLGSQAQAAHRNSVKSALHATAADPGAAGEVEENVEDPPASGTIGCCLNTADQQGCSDLTAADCGAAGGRNLGPGTTCDAPAGGQDPCGDSQGCANEPGDGDNLQGSVSVTASGLAPRAKFSILVGGVRLGTLRTTKAGRGRKRFQGRKLTVDPRGRRIALTNAAGAEVLVGATSDPTAPCGVACCLNTAEEQGCADLTAADCAAAGGMAAGTGTCDADPCPGGSQSGAFVDGPSD